MKKFTFKGVLDGFRSSVSQQARADQEIVETLRPDNFQVAKTFRHGFPYQPTAMAFDPVQRLLAVGSKNGSLRIVGRPGVDSSMRHETDAAVIQLQFLVNEGALLSATADDSIHLWNFRQKRPEVVHSLKFQKEKITYMHLPLQSKWLYVGTEKGNIHIINIEQFVVSGYVINWNKAIEVSRKTHPGPVVHLSDCPIDPSKLLIGYESGQLALWDLKLKQAELRWQSTERLRSAGWHYDGKQFMCSHQDGSLTTWAVRPGAKPVSVLLPHAKPNKDGKLDACKPVDKVEWKVARSGETYVIFSGGLANDKSGRIPSITVVHGKNTTVLEMEHKVIDFITLCESPYSSEPQEPYGIAVLLHNDLVVIDLFAQGFPCFENPYPMDLHESPVTCCTYLADCPSDLIPAFYSVGSRTHKRTGFTEREWPINGGEWSPTSCSYNEIILTGHADGSIRFWDASAGTLQVLYKLKTSKVFEKPQSRSVDGADDDPLAIQLISLCPESRKLCVAGASSHVILFKFRKQESTSDTTTLEIPIVYEVSDDVAEGSPEAEYPPRPSLVSHRGESNDAEGKKSSLEYALPLKVKPGPQKKPAGFQAHIVCITPWVNGEQPGQITALSINSSYGLMAYGNESGIAVVDIVQRTCVISMGTPDLYGSADPYQRVPRSPKRGGQQDGQDDPRCRSPSNDQDKEERDSDSDPATRTPAGASGQPSPEEYYEEAPVGALEPAHRPTTIVTYSPDPNRKRSHSWKGFSFKKQFSKVDMRLKPTRPGQAIAAHQGGSKRPSVTISYPSVTPSQLSPVGTDSPPDSNEDLKEMSTPETEDAPKAYLEDPGLFSPDEVSVEYATEACEYLSDSGMDSDADRVNRRPADLPLFDADGKPMRPPRRRESVMKKAMDKRDGRLLSVPNIKYHRSDHHHLRDLRRKDEASSSAPAFGGFIRRFNKLDSSFSRSRSSSMSSLENISAEAIQCLAFADSYTKKSDPCAYPTLWVGTSLGSVLTLMIVVPAGDARAVQPVAISPCGTIFRLKGCILTMSFLDCNGALIPYSYEPWRDENKESRQKTPTKSGCNSRMSPTLGGSAGMASDQFADRQFVVLTSEKQARVVALPSHNCVYRQQITDGEGFVVKAEIISLKDSVCLVVYVSSGHIIAYSLPSLRPLIDIDFLPLADLSFQTAKQGIVDPMLSIWGQQMFVNEDTDQIARTFCFSNRGHGLFLSSPTEVQKFTVSAEFCSSLAEMVGELFLPRDMPEQPKQSFLQGLFGGGVRSLDREELFGESSGRASRSIAKHIPGPSANIEALKQNAGTAAGAISQAHMMAVERGEKLSQLEERTQRMMNEAENFSSSAHGLMLKYKDKKWYQL
ncbi:syntaxin-binding protein 5 isoform X2 [Frankliniella occidentalis]|uniref:Syntaxin-binding protein 5-like n=1 Tax=Frankliniella occidentalis TaxID=133901 RepID=A0A9C6WQC7_FRAOC|nr:syntaxin-binding protein 5 isoform X2 [Frankliniella occidentalis]